MQFLLEFLLLPLLLLLFESPITVHPCTQKCRKPNSTPPTVTSPVPDNIQPASLPLNTMTRIPGQILGPAVKSTAGQINLTAGQIMTAGQINLTAGQRSNHDRWSNQPLVEIAPPQRG